MEKEKIELTKEGYEDLQKQYKDLNDVQKPRVLEAIANAKAMGDLSENYDYKSAREEQAKIEFEIARIGQILENCVIIEKKKGRGANVIDKSTVVKFKDLSSGETVCVKIVSSVEADPLSNPNEMKISDESALGSSLMGHKAGEKVTVNVANPYDIEILEIK